MSTSKEKRILRAIDNELDVLLAKRQAAQRSYRASLMLELDAVVVGINKVKNIILTMSTTIEKESTCESQK